MQKNYRNIQKQAKNKITCNFTAQIEWVWKSICFLPYSLVNINKTGKVLVVHPKTCQHYLQEGPQHTGGGGKNTALLVTQLQSVNVTNKKLLPEKDFPGFDYKSKPEEILKVKFPMPISFPSTVPTYSSKDTHSFIHQTFTE